MIMAERADQVDNKTNGPNYLENDQISDVEHSLVSTPATFSNPNKPENETEKVLFSITVPLDPQRREENPFSFKHFLKRDNTNSVLTPSASTTNSNNQNSTLNYTGARPKVFSAAVKSTSPLIPVDNAHLKKSKHVNHQDDKYNDNNLTAGKTNSVEDITFVSDSHPIKNLYRSYSDRDTTYKTPNNSDDNFNSQKHISGRVTSSEFSSALPDFVQDHIVLEQWYSGYNSPFLATDNVEREIMSVTSPLGRESRQKLFQSGRSRSEIGTTDHDKELKLNLISGQEVRKSNPVPLDLPGNDCAPYDLPRNNNHIGCKFSNPLDLPAPICLDLTGNVNKEMELQQEYKCIQEVPQILPDFLSDGAIHSDRLADLVQASPEGQGLRRQCPDADNITDAVSRLSLENDRLRRELDSYRRQLSEQSSQLSRLQSELSTSHKNEGQYTTKLATALETVEQNMAKTNKRAVEAENTVSVLKKQISQMKSELILLKNENSALRFGPSSSNAVQNPNMSRLSIELRNAASTAESSLRQLLTGVDNLRSLADSLECSNNRIFEPTDDSFGDNEDEGAGPAL